jgi:hypothetical protein
MAKKINLPQEIYIAQRKMIHEFIKRRYKERYDEELGDFIDGSVACVIESPRGTIDFVEIGDMIVRIDEVRTMQAHNIPCSVYNDWYREYNER